ncbi:MAG TPA: hypothetical protein VEJ46_10645 [Candidatus Acidoferrum sp.]|nr:hypothetical protein [Candidatus Acidoferrum sp.]
MAPGAEAEPKRTSGMQLYWIASGAVMCLALAYLGWVFYSRWRTDRDIEERIAAEKRAQAARTYDGMGGDRFEILTFYASPSLVRRGEDSTLCYGVSNAKSVTLQPQSSPVWPSQGRCVDVTPSKTTTYTLTATDAAGHVKSAQVLVEVR